MLASLYKQAADRIPMHASHTLCAADGVSFEEGRDYGEFLFPAECIHFGLTFQVKQADNAFVAGSLGLPGLLV